MHSRSLLTCSLGLILYCPLASGAAQRRPVIHQSANQERAHTPRADSPEYKAILGALYQGLPNGQRRKKRIGFVVDACRVHGGWAFVEAMPQSIDGQTHYAYLSALLRKQQGHWKMVGQLDPVEEPQQALKQLRSRFRAAPADIFPHPGAKS